jgi:hypothetical protein
MCLSLVALLHGLVLSYLQFHSRKYWPAGRPELALPTISLRLLPLVLQSAATPEPAPTTHSQESALHQSASPTSTINAPGATYNPPPAQPSGALPLEASAQPLNLNLSKSGWADVAARKLPGPLPTHTRPSAWEQFVKTLGPPDEIREERLSMDRVRIHTKHGCYELEQSATKRLDPFNWSPEMVTSCR